MILQGVNDEWWLFCFLFCLPFFIITNQTVWPFQASQNFSDGKTWDRNITLWLNYSHLIDLLSVRKVPRVNIASYFRGTSQIGWKPEAHHTKCVTRRLWFGTWNHSALVHFKTFHKSKTNGMKPLQPMHESAKPMQDMKMYLQFVKPDIAIVCNLHL